MTASLYKSEDDQKSSDNLVTLVNDKFMEKAVELFNRRKSARGKIPGGKIALILSETSYGLYLAFENGKAFTLVSATPGKASLTKEMIKDNIWSAMGKIAGKGLAYYYRKAEINPNFV